MDKSLSMGIPPWHHPGHSRRLKHLTLGMTKASPLFIDNHQVISVEAMFLSLHILCAILGASVCLFAGHLQCWILDILFGRETRSAFLLEYSCASLIPIEYSQLFVRCSCSSLISCQSCWFFLQKALSCFTYTYLDSCLKFTWCLVNVLELQNVVHVIVV